MVQTNFARDDLCVIELLLTKLILNEIDFDLCLDFLMKNQVKNRYKILDLI